MFGGDEVVADPEGEGEEAAGLDLLLGGEFREEAAHVVHPPVVDPPQARRHRQVTPGPIADRELGPQRLAAGDREQALELLAGVALFAIICDRFFCE